ncbi:MAG TPA: VWA domain-containing protein [Acidobacteriaceae bacterium]|jgi:VWFA-related protein|nr:VWA domain-containing protein [Acidobacteriaceae bacterium]
MRILTRPSTHLLLLTLACGLSAPAQTTGTNLQTGQNGTFTISVNSQLVVETVVVKDKDGHFVPGLTQKDFHVEEDGVPQTIRIFEHQALATESTPLPVTPPDQEQITLYNRLVRTQIAPEVPGKINYSGHRLLALYFDMSAMSPDDQLRALRAAEKFVRTQITPADMVAILRYAGGSVDVLQDFTADRNRLLSILDTLVIGEGQGNVESIDDSGSADTGASFGQDDSEFNIFNNDRQLSALMTAAKMLGSLSEKKSLIYFASGMRMSGLDNLAQLHATIDAAVRSGVSFWPIDARGLVAEAPLGDATQGSPGNAAMYSGTAAQALTTRFQQSQDTMYSLGADTGGKALFDNNDLTRGIVQAQKAIEDYYIVGYYTTNTAQNGHFRHVKITVDSPLGAKLDYREGYYANKTFNKFTDADKERQLEDALMLGDPVTDLTIAMEIDYFQLNHAEYYVPIIVKIPGRELALAKKFGAERTLIDFVCEVKDATTGMTMSNVRDNVNIRLSDATAQQLAKRPIEYDAGFTLFPGKYSIKFLARDDETGRIGTFQTYFTIPDLNKVNRKVALSSVVLSSQRIDLNDALYNAQRGKEQAKDDAANPLVQGGQKLIPSVNRVFAVDRTLYVYLQAYARDQAATTGAAPAPAANPTPLVAWVSFYRDQKIAMETQPIAVTPEPTTRLGVVPLNFQVALGKLAPGRYQCQVSVLDPAGHRAAFWQGPVMLIQ